MILGPYTISLLSTLLLNLALSSPIGAQNMCVAASPEIVVKQRRFSRGPPAYVFRLYNGSAASVYVVILGEGVPHFVKELAVTMWLAAVSSAEFR